jgi:hypothetical protein
MAQWSSSMKTQPIPLHHIHTPTYTGLEIMPRDVVSLCKFPCFIIYCLTYKRCSTERFVFISFCFCFLHCYTFSFKTWNFPAASPFFVFSAQLNISLNCAYHFVSSLQNSGCACRTLLYITCYFKGLTNEFQHSRLELRMPCHVPFSLLSTWWFDNAGLGWAQHDPVSSVWYGTSYMNFWRPPSHIQPPNLREKPCLIFE